MPRWIDKVSEAVHQAAAAIRHHERNTGKVERRPAPTARPVAELQVQYTPQLDGDPDPGEVVWTWVPFEEDATLGKDRPVVIIGRRGDVLSGVALTSREHGDGAVDVGTGEWDSRRRTSYAKVDRLLDIDPDTVRREGAILNRRQFDEVIDAVVRRHQVERA